MFALVSRPLRRVLGTACAVLALSLPAAAADPLGAPGLPAPDPQGGVTLPEGVSPEESREMASDVLLSLDVLLQVVDYGSPEQQEELRRQVVLLQDSLANATPEELEIISSRFGRILPELQSRLLVEAVRSVNAAREAEALRGASGKAAAPGAGAPAPAKSAGFPALDPSLPEYPNVAVWEDTATFVNGALDASDKDAAAAFLSGVSQLVRLELCDGRPVSGGRANRRSDGDVYLDFGATGVLGLLNQLQNDACAGFSFDGSIVISFAASLSCQWCCAFYNLVHGVLVMGYESRMLCDSMVDGAELEATYHHVKTTYDAVSHVHGDVEDVQATADEILDLVSCHPVSPLAKQHGCDGLDTDCNGAIDDCPEDAFGPDLHVDEAVGVPWYASPAEAMVAVLRAVSAPDDCRQATVTLDGVTGSCGAVNATVSATDACGNRTTRTAVVKVDGLAPSVVIPASLAGSCHASIDAAEAAVLAAAAISDDCTPAGQLAIQVQSTVTDCSLRVRVSATDLAGHVTSDAVTLRVDTRSPAVDVEQLLLGAMPRCFETIAEAEAAVREATGVTDNCSDVVVPVISSTGSPCSLRVIASATDECGRTATDDALVRVDDAPPTVVATATRTSLWPANHELVDVGLSFSATDDCAGEPVLRVSVTSDETTSTADGAGQDKAPDAVILRNPDGTPGRILLRAERSSAGNGRVYVVLVEATDPCGHVGAAAVTVSVPARSGAAAVDDGQYYDAAQVN